MATDIYIGTSGWHYKHWSGIFYPKTLSNKNFLKYYCKRLTTAEINNSFYQLPKKKTLTEWCSTTPREFIFSIKASRYITHMKKLKDSQVTTKKFFEALAPLKDKIGPILFQLPPRWRCNPGRLETFMANLPHCFRYVFEFRDSSWFNTQVYSLLSKYKAAFCIYDLNKRLSPLEVTTDFAYIRLHGPNGPYEGKYDKNSLEWWSKNFKRWGKDKEIKRIYCYFDNDQVGFAVQNALELQDKINKRR